MTFDGPTRALRCAAAIRAGLARLGVQMRAGLHTGECELVDGEFGGVALRDAARVMALARTGEILASSTVRDLVAGSGIEFEEQDLRLSGGTLGGWRLFRVGRGTQEAASTPARRSQALTRRELEVAVRLARGLTNRQIADKSPQGPWSGT